MSMRPQAHDIIRTWAFDTIVKAWMHNNDNTLGKDRYFRPCTSTEKEKISKSKGNSPLAPEKLLASILQMLCAIGLLRVASVTIFPSQKIRSPSGKSYLSNSGMHFALQSHSSPDKRSPKIGSKRMDSP